MTVLIKIGGLVAQDSLVLESLLKEIQNLKTKYQFILVHGGGKEVTAISEKLGYRAEFQNGVRITSPEEMDVVDMVLGGKLNISLVRQAGVLGLKALGLGGQDGNTFLAKALEIPGKPNCRTGEIVQTNPQLLQLLLGEGYFPILHSTSRDLQGNGLNINADEAAQALAMALTAGTLIYISDIPGVLKNNQVLKFLNREKIQQEIQAGVISGGMIPKVQNALEALSAGVGSVIIGGYKAFNDLQKLLDGSQGTTIQE